MLMETCVNGQGLGTHDDTLIRVVVSRCEIDMVQIKDEFQRQFGKSLDSFIAVRLYLLTYLLTYLLRRRGFVSGHLCVLAFNVHIKTAKRCDWYTGR